MTMAIADGPMPYALTRHVCPHCGEEYHGGKKSDMCPACREGEPGEERKKRWSKQFHARRKRRGRKG